MGIVLQKQSSITNTLSLDKNHPLLAASLFLGCNNTDKTAQPDRIFGPSLTMGNGKVKSWISLDAQRNPTAIGFNLSKGALDNLPTTLPETPFMLALPDEATTKTPFQHIMINWNPMGHEPSGIYKFLTLISTFTFSQWPKQWPFRYTRPHRRLSSISCPLPGVFTPTL